MTCVGNDLGFDHIFQRGIEAFGKKVCLLRFLQAATLKNLVLAIEEAKKRGVSVVSFLGKSGGAMKGKADLELHIQGFATSDRIQEAHMAALHIAIELFERLMKV